MEYHTLYLYANVLIELLRLVEVADSTTARKIRRCKQYKCETRMLTSSRRFCCSACEDDDYQARLDDFRDEMAEYMSSRLGHMTKFRKGK